MLDFASPGIADGLHVHGDRLALVWRGRAITYEELAQRVEATAAAYGDDRRLVLIAAANEPESVIAYLAALHGRHPVMVAPSESSAHLNELVARYDPDVIVEKRGAAWRINERRSGSAHALHPDLALMLSTSGSTGASKVVRLSHGNVRANAEAIAQYLDLRDTDRAALSLPMHYCYGLSVINSHLSCGAGVILSDSSVVDRCFWSIFREWDATSFAGVPYTFDLLDRVGFESLSLPSLRFVMQAGGRLAPDKVRRYAALGRRDGWQLFVMYGQTEATARMAYLPPDKALSHPSAIGVPVPGGTFRIDPVGDTCDAGAGELVFSGPNVMLGYAEGPADLSLGRTVDELRTGDIARRTADGLYEIVGRRHRFIKLFGLRIDLERVEHIFAEDGLDCVCTGDDDHLYVALAHAGDAHRIRRLAQERLGLPSSCIVVRQFDDIPRLTNGKPNYVAIQNAAREALDQSPFPREVDATSRQRHVRDVFSSVLQRPDVDDGSTFVSLGGDSLSYIELSIELEDVLGSLPRDWHITPIRKLEALRPHRRIFKQVESNVLLRAISIALVVFTHTGVVFIQGGAHVLLGVAGFNFARFQLSSQETSLRPPRMMWSAIRVALPAMCWIVLLLALTDDYGIANVFLVNNHFGDAAWDERWRYWYIEALVQIMIVLAVAFAVPAVRRVERANAFSFALGLVALAFAVRMATVLSGDTTHAIYRPHTVLWIFVLGWAAQRADTTSRKLILSALIVLAVPGFFSDPTRKAVLVAGLLLLIWVHSVRIVWPLNRLIGAIAAASLYIYLTHWHVYALLSDAYPAEVAIGAAIIAGLVAAPVGQSLTARLERSVRCLRGSDRNKEQIRPPSARLRRRAERWRCHGTLGCGASRGRTSPGGEQPTAKPVEEGLGTGHVAAQDA